MNIAVISDLHLGTGTLSDEFGHEDNEFLKFLRFLERNFERIVLLGDIWETLASPLPQTQELELQRARAKHKEIEERFLRPQYHFIHGNHDHIAAKVEGAPDEYVLCTKDVNILFTHGHQQDRLFAERQSLSEWGVWLGGWIRRLGLLPLYRLCLALDERRSGINGDGSSCVFQRWAMGMANQRQFDVVVTGHTHLAARVQHGSRLYLNSGSCNNGRFSYLSMDTRQLRFEVHSGY